MDELCVEEVGNDDLPRTHSSGDKEPPPPPPPPPQRRRPPPLVVKPAWSLRAPQATRRSRYMTEGRV